MRNHTPGPWHWEKHNGLMYLMTSNDCDVLGTGIDIADNDIDLPVIAAAADMLAALEAVSVDVFQSETRSIQPGTYQMVCRTLAKAKGDTDDVGS